jgi:plastocyanin
MTTTTTRPPRRRRPRRPWRRRYRDWDDRVRVQPRDVTVEGGDTITVTNDGQLPHNYTVLGREGGGPWTTGDVDPGSSGEVTLNLQPGQYEVICTIPGHAEEGMRGTVTVPQPG